MSKCKKYQQLYKSLTSKELTTDQLFDIIDMCCDRGVTEFKFGDLYLRFDLTFSPTKKAPVASIKKVESINENSLLNSEVDLREDQAQQLLIEDPVAYEKLLAQGDLENAKTHDTGIK